MTTSITYTTSTGASPIMDLSSELAEKLQFTIEGHTVTEEDIYAMDVWCQICQRPTSHVDEHDDLVEKGLAFYAYHSGGVYWV